MKAFIAGILAIAAVAVVAFVVLDSQQTDTAQNFSTQNVRLPAAD